jgi:phage-related protein (TIGR01555 family)
MNPVAKMVMDGWSNLVTGLGSIADKHKKTRALPSIILTDEELEDIYIDDGLGTNIVNMLPDDMFREGWCFDFPEEDPSEAEELTDGYKEILEAINAVAKIREGFYWARLYGGAVILIGALDGQSLDAPLKISRIRSIEYLRVIDRSDIVFSNIKFQEDPEKPRYGLPEYYPVHFTSSLGTTLTQNVHYSRIIEIHGSPIPQGATRYTREQRYWGLSVLQNVEDKLAGVGSSIESVNHLLEEFSVGKYKLSNLANILSEADGAEMIKKRVEVMDLTRSVFHSMYFDKEDDFYRENVSFAGVPEVLHILFMLVSGATGYPITRLFGVSPAGMNSTGESDMRNYYDKVRSKQGAEAEPILLRIIKIISEWKDCPEPYIKWNPLQQLSQKEQAEVDKLEADKESVIATTYQAYINAGVMEPYEARFLQFGDTLDKIPVPEDMLPPVETVSEEENNEGKEGAESEDANEGEQKGEDADEGDESNDPNGKEGDKSGDAGNDPDGESVEDDPELTKKIAAMDKKEVAARIKELEAEKEPSDEEAAELKLLEARLVEIKKEEQDSK